MSEHSPRSMRGVKISALSHPASWILDKTHDCGIVYKMYCGKMADGKPQGGKSSWNIVEFGQASVLIPAEHEISGTYLGS